MTLVSLDSAFPKTVKPGIPRLDPTPDGWCRAPLKRFLYEKRRPIKVLDDDTYRLVTVKRARGGAVERSRLLGREISVKSQFNVEAGDFLISKRQIVHGACSIVPTKLQGSIVSNEYSVINSTEELGLDFLDYLSHSAYFQQTCFHSSIGVHIEKMIFKLDRWLKWEFNIPPAAEQQKIVEILATWDQAIEVAEKQLENAKNQKRALMQQLLTGRRRFPEFEGQEWHEVRLGSVASIDWGDTSITKSAYVETGYPAYSASGQDGFLKTGQITGNGIVLSAIGARCGRCFWAEGKWTAIKNTMVLQELGETSDLKFLFHVVNNSRFWPISGGAQPFIGLKNARNAKIRIPSKREQLQIAKVLDRADEEIGLTLSKIINLRTEKKALMQQLLAGKKRVPL